MIISVVIVSGVQQNDSFIHIHVSFFKFFSHVGYQRELSRVPCVIQEILIGYLFKILELSSEDLTTLIPHDYLK